ncbi:MAG TPA: DNA primase [Caulobacteraceae bacterium]
MRYDERFLDEVKGRLRLSDIIGKTVKLRRQGREYVGLSPFTKEKTPSFFVNDDKGFFHDFSSGKHGDLISFLQETERLSFTEAVERLAAEAGVPLPAPDPRAEAVDRARQGLADWLELAAAWFEAELRRPVGKVAREYLAGRALPESEWGRFRIGYAPAGRTALKDYLIAKGAKAADLVAAGLLILPEDGGSPYDRFRDRIIYPIADGRGRMISFGGRALDPRATAKYLNGPDSSLFDKGRTLYGLAEARRLLHAGGAESPLVVVEGYMDVIACQRAGVAAVAAMGTSLTEAQMEMLWRLHPTPTLSFDGDRAGRQAAARAMDRALPLLKPGRSFAFAIVSGGKDADDILREQGAPALKAQLAMTTSFVDALFRRERDAAPLETPEQRSHLKRRLRDAARAITDADLSSEYAAALLTRYDALFPRASRPAGGRGAWRGTGRDTFIAPLTDAGRAGARRLAGALKPLPAALARWTLDDPAVLEEHLEDLEARGFGDPALSDLASRITALRLTADRLDSEGLRRHLADCGLSALLIDIDQAAAKSGAPFMKPDVTLAAARTQWSCAFEALSRLAALDEALTAAREDLLGGKDSSAHRELKMERDRLKRAIESGSIWQEDPKA